MRYPVSGRDMQALMRSSPGSAREEDKFAGHCCDASVAGLGPKPGVLRLHVLPTRAGGLSNVETFGRIALRGPDNRVVSCPLKEDWSSKTKPSIRLYKTTSTAPVRQEHICTRAPTCHIGLRTQSIAD
jgi:hypothetical protein